ncbi:protein mono-ADP-ribosyltransferase PARP12-like [Adelges cooleyi]|uniref:protein mono-ADP-ribosyltransferase PARP12-like n=1 Tax=Adelges cooleyi TaxID=133065 RepID=UPI00217F7030|nr:protein mono-ADP-ribosyltransferase PARP12-like [Adelges cooleyi]
MSLVGKISKKAAKLGKLPLDDDNVLIECESKEKEWVKKCVLETFPSCSITKIRSVNHRQMYGMYLLRKEELELNGGRVEQRLLYHVTGVANATASLQDGLDWRRTKRAKFGRGVSFSDHAKYADCYADNRNTGGRVIIVCSVLISKVKTLDHGSRMVVHDVHHAGDGYDTTMSSTQRVYVKYDDFEFYPMYMVHYDHIVRIRLTNNVGQFRGYVRPISATEFREENDGVTTTAVRVSNGDGGTTTGGNTGRSRSTSHVDMPNSWGSMDDELYDYLEQMCSKYF